MVTINDKEYSEDDLNDEQKYIIAHIKDIDSKIEMMKFQFDQLMAAKDAFSQSLIKSVESDVA